MATKIKVKLLKCHCTDAGFFRAGAIYGRPIKRIHAQNSSRLIGRDYREWVAIGSTHFPPNPNILLIRKVSHLAAVRYGEEWLQRLTDLELYKAGHILAIARVKGIWRLTEDNLTSCPLERKTGGWQPGRWAVEMDNFIAPPDPIPYNIPARIAPYLKESHGTVYQQVGELIREAEKRDDQQPSRKAS